MKNFYAFLLVAITSISYCQTNDAPGYFISNDGSKTSCLIRFIQWRNNPTEFEYRLTENESYSKATIANVTEFAVEDYRYVRTEVDIDQSRTQIAKVTIDKNPVFERMTVFLRVLVDGKAKLYHYQASDMVRYFYSTDGKPVEQLVFKHYNPDGSMLKENTYFRQQLWNNVRCDSDKISAVENLEYKTEALIRYFESVNVCNGDVKSKVERKSNKGTFRLKAVVLLNSSSLDIQSPIATSSFNFGNAISPGFGVEVEYVLPFNNKKWSVFVEPTYNSYKGDGVIVNPFGIIREEKIAVDMTYINVPLGVRYHFFVNDNSQVFVNSALNIMHITKSSKIDYERQDDREMGYDDFSLMFGVGYNYRKFSVEARFNTGQQIGTGTYEKWEFTNIALVGRYQFL